MSHVVLLGDSIFDNAAYVRGGPDVVEQLRGYLPAGWRATLRAVDGAVLRNVPAQVARVPDDADFLVVSAGGNDALGHVGLLSEGARSMAGALERLAEIAENFEAEYRRMLGTVLERGLPTALCTIYNGSFPDAQMQRLGPTALTHFNDAILRTAFAAGLPLLELRLVCNEPGDYANPIEPSVQGGDKMARVIARVVAEHDFSRRRSEVYVG